MGARPESQGAIRTSNAIHNPRWRLHAAHLPLPRCSCPFGATTKREGGSVPVSACPQSVLCHNIHTNAQHEDVLIPSTVEGAAWQLARGSVCTILHNFASTVVAAFYPHCLQQSFPPPPPAPERQPLPLIVFSELAAWYLSPSAPDRSKPRPCLQTRSADRLTASLITPNSSRRPEAPGALRTP